ncbi:MAG: glycosyltransferase family 4 protein [Candidatus Eisenbacteria bacterium]|uniref:Glycosyltransferase family 4 protein n=1 Tax=Eiseniibacteriota bacterium TaxID=2212470 RepID=A0A538U9Q5_UNCEI|nr:MAG: glycosyltransferase family 4 protein [Candidatus Eisenbacteria bacterium]
MPMRLVLVSQEYPPETARGGIGTQTYAKAHGLARLGHQVVVISHAPDEQRREYDDGPVKVIRVSGYDRRVPAHTLEAWWLRHSLGVAEALAALQNRAPIDLVDFPEYGAEGFMWLLNRGEDHRIPAVIQLHGPLAMLADTVGWPEPGSELYRVGTFMEGTCLRLADGIFSSSPCSADWCARAYGIPREAIAVMHTGIDVERFSPRPVAKAPRPTIVFVGRLAQSKGVLALVEATSRLAPRFPGLQLRLIGRGDAQVLAEIRARAAAAGSPDPIDLVGFVDHADLPEHLSRAHVFAAPSLYEGGPGFVYLEAMACGLPVIACSGSGAAEAVTHEQTGLLVPPGDREALVAALDRLLRDDAAREAMGARARRFAVETADSRQCLRRIEAFYLATLGARDAASKAKAPPVRPIAEVT